MEILPKNSSRQFIVTDHQIINVTILVEQNVLIIVYTNHVEKENTVGYHENINKKRIACETYE